MPFSVLKIEELAEYNRKETVSLLTKFQIISDNATDLPMSMSLCSCVISE